MFKKYPFIKQNETKDCGVTCIEMIFKYYKGYVNKTKLHEMTKTSKDGTTAYHIIETLKYFGFDSKGIECDILNFKNITLPCIAHVTINTSYKHYLVIYEVNYIKKYLIVADPATKVKKISFTLFNQIYNNIVITMLPTKKLPEYLNTESKLKFCIGIVKNYQKLVIRIILFSILITSFSIVTSFYFKYMIDSVSTSNKNYLLFIFLAFSHFYLLKIVTSYFRNKLLIIINQYIDHDMTTVTFEQIIKLPYRYYCNRTTGDIVARISDLELVRTMISKISLTLFVDIILVLSSFIFLYFINSKLFFISILSFIFYLFILFIFRPIIKNVIDKCQKEKASVTSFMVENISSYETIKGLNIEDNIINKFQLKYKKYLKEIFKIDTIYNIENFLKNLINDIIFILIIYIGCLEVINGKITIGGLLTFNSLLLYFLEPIKDIIDLDNNVCNAISALNRVLELFFKEKENGILDKELVGNIKFNNLTYSYNDRDIILKNINLEINNKEKVLILGNSGSGKSTILKLLKKYYAIERNKILINSIDINDYSNNSINNSICYISQNENLFTDTVYNNIILDRKIDSNNLKNVTDSCYIDFLDNKLGFNMLIEENGFNISGGQKQRIILARSLLKNFDILLIDEALNQMDHNLERKILKNIFKNFSDKTIIVVSHRLENIDLFDKVIKLEQGIIKEVNSKNG